MKNTVKKIAGFAMVFTLLGTGTVVTKTISPESDNTIVASAITSIGTGSQIGQISNKNGGIQGMGMYNNVFYFVTQKNNSNCKLYRMNMNGNTSEISLSKSDSQLIGHGNDLCVAKCNGKLCLFVVDGQNNKNILLKYELNSAQTKATLAAKYQLDKNVSAVTLVNPDGNNNLKFIFRNERNIFTAEIGRNESSGKKKTTNSGNIQLERGAAVSQGICYYKDLLIVPYTDSNYKYNYIQVYRMNSNLKIDGYLLDSFKIGKNSKFEIESIDYSNGNNWYYNTNENGYCRLYLNTSLGNAINRIVEARYYEMSRR